MPNKRGVQIVGRGRARGNFENLISGGSEGRVELRNPFLNIKCKFVLFMPIHRSIHSFSTRIHLKYLFKYLSSIANI